MMGTKHVCDRRHMDLPASMGIVRCFHGRIGVNEYAIVEAVNPSEPNHGVFLYSVVPADTVFSLVCMLGYQDAEQSVRDAIYTWYWGQLKYGKTPIDYVMYCEKDVIVRVEHTPDSLDTMKWYGVLNLTTLPLRGALLYGRYAKRVGDN